MSRPITVRSQSLSFVHFEEGKHGCNESNIPIDDRHLDVHQYDVWFGIWRIFALGSEEVVEGFFAVPDGRNGEA